MGGVREKNPSAPRNPVLFNKLEARNSKLETILKLEIQLSQTSCRTKADVWKIAKHSGLEFVSELALRISCLRKQGQARPAASAMRSASQSIGRLMAFVNHKATGTADAQAGENVLAQRLAHRGE